MENLSEFQKIAAVLIFWGIPILIIIATIYSFSYKNKNVAALIKQSGWKHEVIKKGAVERRFSSTSNGIDWTMEFKISQYDSNHRPAQLSYPTILEWHTSSAKLSRGSVVILTTPLIDREALELAYKVLLKELDIWLNDGLSQYQMGSTNFQSRYTLMAETEESARQIVAATENPLLDWPEWEISRLVDVPTPALMVDTNGITIRIGLHRLGVPSKVQNTENPFVERVFAVVRLGIDVATRLRNG